MSPPGSREIGLGIAGTWKEMTRTAGSATAAALASERARCTSGDCECLGSNATSGSQASSFCCWYELPAACMPCLGVLRTRISLQSFITSPPSLIRERRTPGIRTRCSPVAPWCRRTAASSMQVVPWPRAPSVASQTQCPQSACPCTYTDPVSSTAYAGCLVAVLRGLGDRSRRGRLLPGLLGDFDPRNRGLRPPRLSSDRALILSYPNTGSSA